MDSRGIKAMVEKHRYLLIGGTTKAATTSLFNYLSVHPEVCASSMKETRFLLDREYPLLSRHRCDDGIEKYEEFFGHCEGRKLRIEATPDYLYSGGTPGRIKDFLPEARVLFILREPVSRLVSWYKFARQYDSELADISFDDYVELMKTASAAGRKQHLLALEQGRYSVFLRPYFETLERDRICVIFYEELSKDPLPVMGEVCSFAGIDAGFYNGYDFKVYNQTGGTKNPRMHGLYRNMKYSLRKYTHDKRLLYSVLKAVKSAIEPAYTSLNSSPAGSISISGPTELFLKEYYCSEIRLIAELTGKPVPWRNGVADN
jgi:hypothetical protein